jgi:N utilization substance protein A
MSELSNAIRAVCEEKNLSYESVIETIEMALAAAYRKDYGQKNQNIKVEFNPDTGETKIYDVKTVVANLPEDYFDEEGRVSEKYRPKKEEFVNEDGTVAFADGGDEDNFEDDENVIKFNPKTEIQLNDALMIQREAELGQEIVTELTAPKEYGRMAAQTAKQVIIQKLREAEREMVLDEFKDKEGEVITGVVQRREGRNILVDLGKAIGRLSAEEQIYGEQYEPGDKIKVYVREVRSGNRGPEIVLSRTSEEILKKVFVMEIPEIANGILEIKGVAREAGSRSKVAIWTDAENVDPIGSCVGQRGSRIQTITSELGGERIDIVNYDDDASKFIANSLSPAKVLSVTLDEYEKKALVKVAADQLSLAIGKRGQNVRLAARLTGWKIDIMEDGDGTSAKLVSEDASEEDKASLADKLVEEPTEEVVKEASVEVVEEKTEEKEEPKKRGRKKKTEDAEEAAE